MSWIVAPAAYSTVLADGKSTSCDLFPPKNKVADSQTDSSQIGKSEIWDTLLAYFLWYLVLLLVRYVRFPRQVTHECVFCFFGMTSPLGLRQVAITTYLKYV